jgi:hypothetical protein
MTEIQAASAYLASRQALVVLDNCEHLLDACAAVGEALQPIRYADRHCCPLNTCPGRGVRPSRPAGGRDGAWLRS